MTVKWFSPYSTPTVVILNPNACNTRSAVANSGSPVSLRARLSRDRPASLAIAARAGGDADECVTLDVTHTPAYLKS